MRFFARALFPLLIIPFAQNLAVRAADTAAPAIFRRTLPSGLRLIVREMPGAGTVALDIRVRSGSAADSPDHSGEAHFIEHMLFKGTETRAPGDIDTPMETIGGEMDARTSRDWTQYSVSLPPGEKPWRAALTLLADMLQHPAFRPADIDAERHVVQAEIALAQSEPLRTGYSRLYEAAFASDDPYRLPLMGSRESLAALSDTDLRAFWAARYAPANLTVVVAGDVRRTDVEREVLAAFPGIADIRTKEATVTVTHPLAGIVRASQGGSEPERDLATVLIGLRASGAETPDDMPALDVMMSLLYDSNGPSGRGRLFRELIQKRKIAVSVSAEYLPGRTGGLIVLTATGARRDAAALEDALALEIGRLREEPPDESEVASARSSVLGSLLYEMQTPAGAARRLALLDALDLPPALADSYIDRLSATGPEDIKRVATRYMTPGHFAVAVVGKQIAPTPSTAGAGVTP